MAHMVFVSHSSKDKEYADTLCRSLESEGIPCWIAPRDIRPGAEYAEGIIDAIEASRYFVLILSANANQSPQVLREVERAVSKGIPIVPFRIQDIPLSKSLEYFISSHHWLDATKPPLEEHVASLTSTIKNYMAQPKDSPMDPNDSKSASSSSQGQQPNAFSWRVLIWATLAAFLVLGLVALLYFTNPLSPSRPMDDQSARLWQNLATLGDNAQGGVEVWVNQERFHLGEPMELTVTAPEDGYLNVLHMHEHETRVTALFPNRFQPDNTVKRGQVVTIPGPDAGYALNASEPIGLSQIVVLLTSQPLNAYADLDLPSADAVFNTLKETTTRSFVVQATSQETTYFLGRVQVMVIE